MVNKITQRQKEFLDWEFGVFFHFGIRTFYEGHIDWDLKPMDASGFNPTELDCESWIKTIKEAGAKYAILVTKHHDGFALWPSEYTDYCVKNTPWKEGKGDVVKEYVDACRKHDIKVGLYYSPAQFGTKETDPVKYCDYFVGQLSELLKNYGKIDYIWFDGNGSAGIDFDKERIIEEIRTLQPDILIFNMWDPDTRWIGNERGFVPMPNYNKQSKFNFTIFDEALEEIGGEMYVPAECDFKMCERTWFYSDTACESMKTLDELVGIYYMSVGRGANFLINIGPDRRGLLPDGEAQRLLEFGKEIKRRFKNPIEPCKITRDENMITLEFDREVLINTMVIKEDLEVQDVVDNYTVSAYGWDRNKAVDLFYGTTIGHKAICEFQTISSNEFYLETNRPAEQITDIKLYYTK